jgi:hypothetical protein
MLRQIALNQCFNVFTGNVTYTEGFGFPELVSDRFPSEIGCASEQACPYHLLDPFMLDSREPDSNLVSLFLFCLGHALHPQQSGTNGYNKAAPFTHFDHCGLIPQRESASFRVGDCGGNSKSTEG